MRDRLKQDYLVGGDPPSPIDPAPGCRFAQRCPWFASSCRQILPALDPVEADHFAACLRVSDRFS
jgi:peptide/nickel transport system ATP-binding protein